MSDVECSSGGSGDESDAEVKAVKQKLEAAKAQLQAERLNAALLIKKTKQYIEQQKAALAADKLRKPDASEGKTAEEVVRPVPQDARKMRREADARAAQKIASPTWEASTGKTGSQKYFTTEQVLKLAPSSRQQGVGGGSNADNLSRKH